MRHPLLAPLAALLLIAAALAPLPAAALPGAELPPGERYRLLSLLLLLSGETDPVLVDAMDPGADAAPKSIDLDALEALSTPLARIADPRANLARAAAYFRYARAHGDEIRDTLYTIEAGNPVLIGLVNIDALVEEAIVTRTALADSVQYLDPPPSGEAARRLERFRLETVKLRNVLEYNRYVRELDALTAEAVGDLDAKLGAYQRMVDAEADLDIVRERIAAAEEMNAESELRFDEREKSRTGQLMLMLLLLAATVD